MYELISGLIALAVLICVLICTVSLTQAVGLLKEIRDSVRSPTAAGPLDRSTALPGNWPPKAGDQLTLVRDLVLRTAPGLSYVQTGLVRSSARVNVVKANRGWVFAQAEDDGVEGWAQLAN